MSKYPTTSENEGVRCPYCGEMYNVQLGIRPDIVMECEGCSMSFKMSSSIFYITAPDCELNGQEHEWSWEIEPGFKQCLICGKGVDFKGCPLTGEECDRADEQVGDMTCDGCNI